MKFNKLKTCLLIVLLALTSIFISCEHNSKPSGNVMLSVSGRVMNILAARAGEELSDLTLNISLYDSNDKELETKSEANWDKEEKRSITFKPVEIGTVVYAKATLYAGEEKLYEGTTESKSIETGGITLKLILKAVKSELPDNTDNPDDSDNTEEDVTITSKVTYIFQDDLGNNKSSETSVQENKEFAITSSEEDISAYIASLSDIINQEDYSDYDLYQLLVIYADEDKDWLTLDQTEKDSLIATLLANGKNNTGFEIEVYLRDKSLQSSGAINLDPTLQGLIISYNPDSALTFRNCINIPFSVTPPPERKYSKF